MNTSRKGAVAERRARAILEAAGFSVVRAAASKGPADLVAWDSTSIRFVSVKSGSAYASGIERETLALMARPANSSAEIWRFPNRCRAPIIERL